MTKTYLPFKTFEKSCRNLDTPRLAKMRLDIITIRTVLATGQEPREPSIRMWKGYEPALNLLLRVAIDSYILRGLSNNLDIPKVGPGPVEMPWWMGRRSFHEAQRGLLIYQDPEFYGPRFPDTDKAACLYPWPYMPGSKINPAMNGGCAPDLL